MATTCGEKRSLKANPVVRRALKFGAVRRVVSYVVNSGKHLKMKNLLDNFRDCPNPPARAVSGLEDDTEGRP
ncbi:hypothetical protein AAVH_20350 [Aphelenchoides avenae]|nr:hypothetical protein AAVH_20350 [Aphelenchus avenae]